MADDRKIITVQVFTTADAAEAENVAVRAANFIEESLDSCSVQTVLVHSAPFSYTEAGFVLSDKANVYTGDGA